MSVLYVGVDNVITTLLTQGNAIVAYTELERNEQLLDRLYSLIKTCKPTKVNFMVRGLYSDIRDDSNVIGCNLTINGTEYYCNMSKVDIDIIRHLCQKAEISSYRIVDRLGYFAAIKKNNTCFVSPYGDMTEVITVANGVKDISYTRPLNLESVLLQSKRNFGVTNFVDVSTYADVTLLSKWQNYSEIQDKKALVNITMLSYLDTDASDFFELEHKVLKEKIADTHGKWQGLIKKKSETTPKGVQKHTSNNNDIKEVKYANLSSLTSIAIVVLFITIIASLAINKYVSQDASAIERQKANIIVEVDNYNSQENYLSDYLENYNNEVYSAYLSKILNIKTKCCLGAINFQEEGFSIVIYSNNERQVNKFRKQVATQFNVVEIRNLGSVSVNDDSMTKYEIVIAY